MTDLPSDLTFIPSRLGTRLAVEGDHLIGSLVPPPALCTRGTVSMAAVVFLVDAVAGVSLDSDPDSWSFTSELSVRLPLAPTPDAIDAVPVILRDGKRSSTSEVELTVDGEPWGGSLVSFARVPRRENDPPKHPYDPATIAARIWAHPLEESLRSAAGFVSRDPAEGVVVGALRPDLLNPAGAMQGALVAGLIESAAEDLADHHLGGAGTLHVVTEMELRYLAQNRTSPITSRARFIGPPSEGLLRVDLIDDDGRGRLTTAAMVRVRPAP